MSKAALHSSPSPDKRPGWMAAPVSSQSRFGDDLWWLDIETAGWRQDQSRVDWIIPLPENALITPAEHAALIQAAKRFLWTMATDPPSGRKRSSPKTLQIRAILLRILLLWMAAEGISRFAEIDRRAVERFSGWLRSRPGQRRGSDRLAPNTLVNYLIVLKDLYRQRAKLEDALLVDPLPLETTYEAAGATRDTKGAIPFIPDAIAIDLLSKALSWVEMHGDTIVAAETLRREELVQPPLRRGDGAARRTMCGARFARQPSSILSVRRSTAPTRSEPLRRIWWQPASSLSPASSACG